MGRVFDTVEYSYEMDDEITHRYPEMGDAHYHIGTNVIVRSNQNVIIQLRGQSLDRFEPGHHVMSKENLSLLIEALGNQFDETSTFPAEIYFVRTNSFHDRKWKTSVPFLAGDSQSGRAFIQGIGKYSFNISDSKKFLEYFDTPPYSGKAQIQILTERIIDILIQSIQQAIIEICIRNKKPLLDILNYQRREISETTLNIVNKECLNYGITVRTITIEGFNIAENNSELMQTWSTTHKQEKVHEYIEFDPNFIFVITAFQSDMEPVFLSIDTAARATGLTAKRVKDVPGDYRITERIIEMIHKARFVVADLTHERPNVYFELGYARGLGKTVVTLAREGTNVHFDVKDWTYISYIDLSKLQNDLIKRFDFELSNDLH